MVLIHLPRPFIGWPLAAARGTRVLESAAAPQAASGEFDSHVPYRCCNRDCTGRYSLFRLIPGKRRFDSCRSHRRAKGRDIAPDKTTARARAARRDLGNDSCRSHSPHGDSSRSIFTARWRNRIRGALRMRCPRDMEVQILSWLPLAGPACRPRCGARSLGEHQRDELTQVGSIPTLRTAAPASPLAAPGAASQRHRGGIRHTQQAENLCST